MATQPLTVAGDWVKHDGSGCPVRSDIIVEAECPNGDRYEGPAGEFMTGRWSHSRYLNRGLWIIAYRVVPQ